MRGLTFCLAAVAASAPLTVLAGDAPADIRQDTVWRADEDPWRITDSTVVHEGATLTIEPGTVVELDPMAVLEVAGALVARGTEAAPITFTGRDAQSADDYWEAIRFVDSSTDAVFQDVDDYVSGSVIEWCILEHARHAVTTLGASPYVANSVFRDNTTEPALTPPGGAALRIDEGSAPRIYANTFERNETRGFGYGGAIYASYSQPVIQDNRFVDNRSAYGGAISTDTIWSPIVGNTFEGNEALTEGGGVSLLASSSAFLNNTMIGNHAAADGGGLHVCVVCYPHANPFVIDNTITGNTSADNDPADGAGGVGAAYLRSFFDNNVFDNTRDGEPADFVWHHESEWGYHTDVANTSVAGNWWGTVDLESVEATVVDGADVAHRPAVVIEPVRQSAVDDASPRLTVASRKIQFKDQGDSMDVFLTLYNPDSEPRSLDVLVMVQYGDDVPLPVAVPVLGQSTTTELGVTRVEMPANAVEFRTIAAPEYNEALAGTHGYWIGALYDADTGVQIGRTITSRFEFASPTTATGIHEEDL